jgi:hypothetical protein
MVQMSPARTKAIFVPSGDQAGATSAAKFWVSRTWSVPSGSIE